MYGFSATNCFVLSSIDSMPGDDREAQVLEFVLRVARRVVDDAVDVALGVQLERRQAHVLRALLPRQIQPPGDVREALRLDGAEHAVAHRQDQVAGRERYRAAGIAQTEHDADVRHVDVAHLRDQPRDAVRLIRLVGGFFGVRAGGVHQADDRDVALRALADELRGGQVMLGTPHAVAHERSCAMNATVRLSPSKSISTIAE